MRYSHSSVWLISQHPTLAWLLSAQFVFLHRKSEAEFSSVHDVLPRVRRAQHFTRPLRLARRSPRGSRAGQGAGARQSRARRFAVSWLIPSVCHRLFWLGSLLLISTDAVTRESPLCSALSAFAADPLQIVRSRQRDVRVGHRISAPDSPLLLPTQC